MEKFSKVTGVAATWMTWYAVEPSRRLAKVPWPRVPMTIRPHSSFRLRSLM